MKSAKFATRCHRFLWAGILAVSLVTLAPGRAQASAPMFNGND